MFWVCPKYQAAVVFTSGCDSFFKYTRGPCDLVNSSRGVCLKGTLSMLIFGAALNILGKDFKIVTIGRLKECYLPSMKEFISYSYH